MFKLMFSDVDDTLISKKLEEEMIIQITNLTKTGVDFILASGRPTENLINIAKEMTNQGANLKYVCGFNGAQIYDIKNESIIYNNGLNKSTSIEIVEFLSEIRVDSLIYKDDIIYTTNMENEYGKFEGEINNFEVKEMTDIFSTPKVLGLCEPSCIDEKIILIKEKFPELNVVKSKPFFIEITKKNVSKGDAVKKIVEIFNLNLSEDVAICGDSGNDLSMFTLDIKYKYAIGNATEEIKANATEILDTCDNLGVAKKIKELIKI